MSHPASDPAGGTGRWHRRPVVVVAVVALAVGLLLGGLVGALVAGSADGGSVGDQAAPTGAPAPSSGPGDAAVRIDEACLQALDAARQAYDTLGGAGQALADLDAARLDEIIDRLQPLEQRLRGGADDCDVAATFPGGSGDLAPPSTPVPPSESPSG